MEVVDKKKIVAIISGIKLCPKYNSCNHSYCKNEELLFSINDTRFEYVIMTMKQHNLSYSDLERLLVAYGKFFNKHSENEEELIGKIQKIYNIFELENTKYKVFMYDVCPII